MTGNTSTTKAKPAAAKTDKTKYTIGKNEDDGIIHTSKRKLETAPNEDANQTQAEAEKLKKIKYESKIEEMVTTIMKAGGQKLSSQLNTSGVGER